MRRVAVFGNAGGGKSTLARQLAEITHLPLHSLDTIKYKPGGGEVPHNEYLQVHSELLRGDEWIIDGFGCVPSAWERFAIADTLVYVDLPLLTHYAWVTKRLVKGLVVTPEGWPENSPMCNKIRTYTQMAQPDGFTARSYVKVCSSTIDSLREYARTKGERPDGSFSAKCRTCSP